MPESGDLEELVAAVAQVRGRPIRLLPVPPATDGPTGLWAATEQADYVIFPESAAPTHRAAVICHELAHMALGHQPNDLHATLGLVQFAAPTLDPQIAVRLLARDISHDCPQEIAAERLGTRLVAKLSRNADKARWSGVTRRLH